MSTETPKVEILKVGLLYMRVCATKDCTDEYIEDEANRLEPTGIESQWRISREVDPVYCQCVEDENRHHVVMAC